mgnify:FL=1
MTKVEAVVLVAVLMMCGCAGWTRADTYRQVGVVGLSGIDWLQTRKIAQNPDRWYERNPVLGRHPSIEKVDAWFAGTIAVNTAVAMILPPGWREGWQYVSIGWEGTMVGNNMSIGLGIGF